MAQKVSRSTILVGACITLLVMFFWIAIFRDYWIMQEPRYYYSGENRPAISPLAFFLTPEGINERFVSMALSRIVADVVGQSTPVINIIQLFLLGLGLFLLFCHSVQVTQTYAASIVALILTILSSATVGLLLWQATQHDKLMIIFTVLVLIVNFYFIQSTSVPWGRVFIFSIMIIFLVAIANNSKETAIFVPVALLGQIMILMSPRDYTVEYKKIIPSAIVGVYDFVYYLAYFLRINPDWERHISGGNSIQTTIDLTAYLVNGGNFMNLSEWGTAHYWAPRRLN